MIPLTPKQLELLEYLRSCSISPTFSQMCGAVGIGSKSSITRLLSALERGGFIRRTRWARSIELLDQSVHLGAVPTDLLRAELDRRMAAGEPSQGGVMNRREKRQLQILLGELRNGTDIESAAVVAEMSLRSAVDHMRAEERGEYADIVHIQPILVFDGEKLVVPPPIADTRPM